MGASEERRIERLIAAYEKRCAEKPKSRWPYGYLCGLKDALRVIRGEKL